MQAAALRKRRVIFLRPLDVPNRRRIGRCTFAGTALVRRRSWRGGYSGAACASVQECHPSAAHRTLGVLPLVPRRSPRQVFSVSDPRVEEAQNFVMPFLVAAVAGQVLDRAPVLLRFGDRRTRLPEEVEQTR
jgi:hypothetical protein